MTLEWAFHICAIFFTEGKARGIQLVAAASLLDGTESYTLDFKGLWKLASLTMLAEILRDSNVLFQVFVCIVMLMILPLSSLWCVDYV